MLREMYKCLQVFVACSDYDYISDKIANIFKCRRKKKTSNAFNYKIHLHKNEYYYIKMNIIERSGRF